MKVADLGGGIGGPARMLATKHGCDVTVVDLTKELCDVGEMLTKLTKLEGCVRFKHASALDTGLPFGAFDLVWMQNASMNIEDRRALYREVARLLRPGGVYALQEAAAGPVQPAYYPSGWASTAEASFLYSPDQVRRWLADAGFTEAAFEDISDMTTADQQRRVQTGHAQTVPSYSPPEVRAAANANGVRNAQEHRVINIRGVFRKS
jgi:ubiquinone/menaquinone biosynthesis C-methylase UbiE